MYHNETIKNIIIKYIPALRRRKQILFDEYNHSWREQNLFMTHIKREKLLINVGFFFRFKQLKTVCSTKQTIQPYTPISTFYKSEENVAGFFIACTDAADGIKVCLSFLMIYNHIRRTNVVHPCLRLQGCVEYGTFVFWPLPEIHFLISFVPVTLILLFYLKMNIRKREIPLQNFIFL